MGLPITISTFIVSSLPDATSLAMLASSSLVATNRIAFDDNMSTPSRSQVDVVRFIEPKQTPSSSIVSY